jgi:hypothetical protein
MNNKMNTLYIETPLKEKPSSLCPGQILVMIVNEINPIEWLLKTRQSNITSNYKINTIVKHENVVYEFIGTFPLNVPGDWKNKEVRLSYDTYTRYMELGA